QRPRAFEDAELEARLHLAQLANRRMVERDDRAFLHGAELAQHVYQLLLETLVGDGQLFDLDHKTNLAQRQLDDVVEQRDVLALAGVELPQLGRSVVAHESRAVRGALERVVVNNDEPAVGRQVDVALDEVAASLDGRAKRPHRVLRMMGWIAAMASEQWPALVVRVLVTRSNALSQRARAWRAGLRCLL